MTPPSVVNVGENGIGQMNVIRIVLEIFVNVIGNYVIQFLVLHTLPSTHVVSLSL